MPGKLLRLLLHLTVLIFALKFAACLGSGALPFSSSAVGSDPGDADTEGLPLDPNDTGPFLPGPFDAEEDPRGHSPRADAAEPSVFSTQIGEGHTPERPEYLCRLEIYLHLDDIAADHESACEISPWKRRHEAIPPRVTLHSPDPGFEIKKNYEALCDNKGWEIFIEEEAIFSYNYTVLHQVPRNFELAVEILQDGLWSEARRFKVTLECPWPAVECIDDGCEPEEPPPEEEPPFEEPPPTDKPTDPKGETASAGRRPGDPVTPIS